MSHQILSQEKSLQSCFSIEYLPDEEELKKI